jgi:hypothetical protein
MDNADNLNMTDEIVPDKVEEIKPPKRKYFFPIAYLVMALAVVGATSFVVTKKTNLVPKAASDTLTVYVGSMGSTPTGTVYSTYQDEGYTIRFLTADGKPYTGTVE